MPSMSHEEHLSPKKSFRFGAIATNYSPFPLPPIDALSRWLNGGHVLASGGHTAIGTASKAISHIWASDAFAWACRGYPRKAAIGALDLARSSATSTPTPPHARARARQPPRR